MNAKSEDRKDQAHYGDRPAASECGATHSDCPNTWKGTCDREAGHDGSHHCSQCNGVF